MRIGSFGIAAAMLLLASTPAYAEPGLEGIDVSHHNGPVDWKAVQSHSVGFVYVKASEGMTDVDPLFQSNWLALGEQGMPRGAYHFFVTEDDPTEQAKLFFSTYQPRPGDLLPAIDIEVLGRGSGAEATERLAAFIALVKAEIGASPIIYTNANFWNSDLAGDPQLLEAIRDCPLWIAEYGVAAPKVPSGWSRWTIWQWASGQTTPGITGGVDRNRVNEGVTLVELQIPPAQ